MKRLTEFYKLYRDLPIFEALLSSLEELGEKNILPMELIPLVVHQYDQVAFNLIQLCENEITFTATLLTFRILPDTQWFDLANVTIKQTPSRASRRGSKQLCKVERMNIWCMDSLSDNGGKMILKQGNNPYVLEVEEIKKVRKKAKFIFDKETKDKNVHIFDPRLHTMELSRAQDTKLSVKSYLGPMPYNEKLRRGGKERALEIAEAQLGKIEVLKGRYRNRAREYPHRLVEDRVMGKTRDNKMVPGKKIYKRKYFTNILTQDRSLAEMAVKAGGCLALTAHNIHVAPISKPRVDVLRESYRTRRKCNIEMSTFDSRQSFSIIKLEEKSTVSTCSSSDSEIVERRVGGDNDGAEGKTLVKRGPRSRMKLKITEPVTPDSNHSSSCNEDFSWKKSRQFNDRQKDEIKNEALVNSLGKNLEKDSNDNQNWDSLINEITEGIERQEFQVKEEVESRQNSFELRRYRIKKVKEDFKKFNDGEEDNLSISFDLDI